MEPASTNSPFTLTFNEGWQPTNHPPIIYGTAGQDPLTTSSNWNTYWSDYAVRTSQQSRAEVAENYGEGLLAQIDRVNAAQGSYWYDHNQAQAAREFDREQEITMWTGRHGYPSFREAMTERAADFFIPKYPIPEVEVEEAKPFSFLSSIETND